MLSLFHVFLEFQLTNIIFSIYANFFYTMPSCLVLFTITMAHFLQRRGGDLGAHRKRRNFLKVRIFQSIETFNRNFVLLLLLLYFLFEQINFIFPFFLISICLLLATHEWQFLKSSFHNQIYSQLFFRKH